MKNILLLVLLGIAIFFSYGCESAHNQNKYISLANIRSVVEDPVLDCAVEHVHQHNGIHYSGHYNNDGHGHHGLQADNICTINSCSETNVHNHNGIHYAGHHGSCGNSHTHGHKNSHH
jgi:hypothetical protein